MCSGDIMKKNIKNVLFSLFSGVALFYNISLFKDFVINDMSPLYNMNYIAMCLVSIIVFCLYKFNNIKIDKSKKILSYLFALFMILGETYVTNGSMFVIWANVLTLLITLIKLIGYVYLFDIGFYYLDKLMNYKFKKSELKVNNKLVSRYIKLFEKYPFRTSLISILIVWSVMLIAFYPIVLSPDPSYQILMYFNIPTKYVTYAIQRDPNVFMTAHHPVVHSYLLGFMISLGRAIINDNFGLFLYTLLQTITLSCVLSFTIKFAKKNNISTKWLLVLLGIYLFVPMYSFYSVSAVKDTYYSAFMILFVLFIYDFIDKYKNNKISISYSIYLYFVMLLIGLFRNNGIYVITLTILFVIFYSRKNILRIGIPFVLFFASMFVFNNVIIPGLGISDGSAREMFSVPFQQTARLVSTHPNFYNKKDKKIINKVLKYKTLANRYDPELADPVKNKYNKETTSDDLKDYFKVWFKGLVKHPLVYVDATLNNTYGYLYPNTHKWYIYFKYDTRIIEHVDYSYNNLQGLRDVVTGYGNIFPYIPIIGLLVNIGFGTWSTLILTIYLLDKKNRKYILVLLPIYGSLVFCFLGPANTYFRYAMPYLFVLPVISMLLVSKIKGGKNEKK